MIGNRYNKIVKCKLVSKYDTYDEQYLLTFNNCDNEFEVDLKSDFYFNTGYDSVSRKIAATINTINDLKTFCKEHNINIPNDCLKDNYLYIGGCRDYKLDNNLVVMDFIEEK